MTYRETDSTEPPTKIHKVLRAKSKKKKKKKRKSPPRRTLVGIPHEELGDGSGSIFGGEGDGGGMGESYDPSIVEGLGSWALGRLFHHTGMAAGGFGGISGPQQDRAANNWGFNTPWDAFKDVASQGIDATLGESIKNSLLNYLHEEGIDLGIRGTLVPNEKTKKNGSSCGCKCKHGRKK